MEYKVKKKRLYKKRLQLLLIYLSPYFCQIDTYLECVCNRDLVGITTKEKNELIPFHFNDNENNTWI